MYYARCQEVNADIALSVVVIIKALKYAGVSESDIVDMSLEDKIKVYMEIWKMLVSLESQMFSYIWGDI